MTAKKDSKMDQWVNYILNNGKNRHEFVRGLILAYTPKEQNEEAPGLYQLALLRKESTPSQKEHEIVKTSLKKQLGKNGRFFLNMFSYTGFTTEPNATYGYDLILWEEAVQPSLIPEQSAT